MPGIGVPEFTELLATTMEHIEGDLVDNVLTSHPTLDLFKENYKSITGTGLRVNLKGALLGKTGVTDGSGTFDTSADGEIIGSAQFGWSKPIVTPTRLIWEELQQNQGKEQIVDMLKEHIKAAEEDHALYLVGLLHARAGAGELVANTFNSLDQIVSDAAYDADPAGDLSEPAFTVGGIDASTAAFWQAQRIELPLDNATYGSGKIRKAFRHVTNQLAVAGAKGSKVTHIVAGLDVFEEFEDSFDDKVRYVEFGEGKTRFTAIMHGDIEVRLDPDCPPNRAYFLDKDSLRLRVLNGNFMKVQPAQQITGTLDHVTPMASVLTVGVAERRANAVLLRPSTAGGAA